jgi:DHA3 family macrolide efflux protein-like MFS transporter
MEAHPEPVPRPVRDFWLLWSGEALSLLGTQAAQLALVWWITKQTGSAAILAASTFLALAPQILFGAWIGALVDRWDRRKVLLWSDLAAAAVAGALGVLFAAGRGSVAVVLVALFARAVAGAFQGPAMTATTTLMVPPSYLTRIQGVNQALQGTSIVISAPLGALLYAALPMPGVMAVDVGTAAFAIAPLLLLDIPSPPFVIRSAGGALASLFADVKEGFRFLAGRRRHLVLLLLACALNLLLVPAFSLLPLWVKDHGGEAASLGWVQSAFGIGSIAGGLVLGAWGGFDRRIRTTGLGIVLLGGATLAMAAVSPLGALVAMATVGLAVPLANGPILAILQTTIPPEVQGRIFSMYGSLAATMTPVGLLLAAPVAEVAGVDAWYVASGALCLAIGSLMLARPSIVDIERAGDEAAALAG